MIDIICPVCSLEAKHYGAGYYCKDTNSNLNHYITTSNIHDITIGFINIRQNLQTLITTFYILPKYVGSDIKMKQWLNCPILSDQEAIDKALKFNKIKAFI